MLAIVLAAARLNPCGNMWVRGWGGQAALWCPSGARRRCAHRILELLVRVGAGLLATKPLDGLRKFLCVENALVSEPHLASSGRVG